MTVPSDKPTDPTRLPLFSFCSSPADKKSHQSNRSELIYRLSTPEMPLRNFISSHDIFFPFGNFIKTCDM
jgi:hypothetical protein